MGRDERYLSIAGRFHARSQKDWHWILTQPTGGVATRIHLYRIRKSLGSWARRVTVDEPALAETRRSVPPGTVILLRPDSIQDAPIISLVAAYSILARPHLGFGALWILPEDRIPEEVREKTVTTQYAPADHNSSPQAGVSILVSRDACRDAPSGAVYSRPDRLMRLLARGASLTQVPVSLQTGPEFRSTAIGDMLNGFGGTRVLTRIAESLSRHHPIVRNAHLQFEPAQSSTANPDD